MPGDVVAEILAHQTHEVIAGVADMVFGLVLVPLHAHVAVDGVQALRDGAAALDVRLLDADDFQVAAPIAGFVGGSAPAHAATDDKDVGIHVNGFAATHHTQSLLELTRLQRRQRGNIERLGLMREVLGLHHLSGGRGELGRRRDRSPGRGPDRRDEILFAAVAKLDLPRDGPLLLLAAHAHAVAERREVGIATESIAYCGHAFTQE